MLGAFAGPTMQPDVDGLRGDCIMAYRGDFIPRTSDAPYRGRRGAYAMETEDFFIVPPAGSLPGELVDVFEYPASAVNEPPAGVDAKNYPLGLQIIGKTFDEQNILNIAYAMEEKIQFKNKITDWWIK